MLRRDEIHVFLRGGLGNQLYQYTVAKELSIRFSKGLVLREDLLPLERDVISGVARWPNQLRGFQHSGQISYRRHQPPNKTNLFGKFMQLMRKFGDFAPNLAVYLGWLSSERVMAIPKVHIDRLTVINSYSVDKELIAKNRDAILRELETLVNPSNLYLQMKTQLSNTPKTLVHIRKGDYSRLGDVYGVIRTEFYLRSIELLREKKRLYPIWIFTDTPSALEPGDIKFLEPERIFGPGELQSPLENLLLLSKGGSLIASNSTFSWWASQLSDNASTVVAPVFSNAKVNNFCEMNEPRDNIIFLRVD